jgi:hypothetical protein
MYVYNQLMLIAGEANPHPGDNSRLARATPRTLGLCLSRSRA